MLRLARLLPLLLWLVLALPAVAAPPPRATVYVFLATDCPIAGRYGPRLAALSSRFAPKGVRFVAVFPNAREDDAGVRQWMDARRLGRFAISRMPALAERFGARVSPEATLTDGAGKVRYQGRIDDADDAGRVRTRDLTAALEAVLAGKGVARSRTEPFGCRLTLTPPPPPRPEIGYGQVAPILYKKCVACHRPGEVGPMRLDTYESARAFATKIREQLEARKMPPWKADSEGEFHDEKKLNLLEKRTLLKWIDAGAPPDPEPTPAPPLPPPTKEWALGPADALYTMPEYTTPSEGKDIYRCFVIRAGDRDQDHWVQGIEFVPGARAVVHHASVFVDPTHKGRQLDDADPGPGYTNPTPSNGPGFEGNTWVLGGWTPGHSPRLLPDGVGLPLPKGADLILEVHYHLIGKPETDRTRFGVHYAKVPVTHPFKVGGLGNQTFRVPPGAKSFPVTATMTLTDDATIYSVTPHMHEYGRRMRVTAELPSGEFKKIIDLVDWDFNWQPSYRYVNPLKLPLGTRLDLTAWYDNPTDHELRWGPSTKEEMCVLFVGFTLDTDTRAKDPARQ